MGLALNSTLARGALAAIAFSWLACEPRAAEPAQVPQVAPKPTGGAAPPSAVTVGPAPEELSAPQVAPSSARASEPSVFRDGADVSLLCADAAGVSFVTATHILRRAVGADDDVTLALARGVTRMLTDDVTLLFASHRDASVRAVPLTGGRERILFARDGYVGDLALHAGFVYFTWQPSPRSVYDDTDGRGVVMKVPVAGGSAQQVAAGLTDPLALAVGADELVVAERIWRAGAQRDLQTGHLTQAQTVTFRIQQRTDSGAWRLLAREDRSTTALTVEPDRVYWWSATGVTIRARASDETARYAASILGEDAAHFYTHESRQIHRRPKPYGAPVPLATEASHIHAFSVGGARLYWVRDEGKQRQMVTMDVPAAESKHVDGLDSQ